MNNLKKANEDRQNIIPITEYVDDITLKVNGIHYMRWQIPLIVAYSITTHKSQSMTAHNGIVYEPSIRSPFTRGLPYVALSRATDLDKVSLLSAIRNDHHDRNLTTAGVLSIYGYPFLTTDLCTLVSMSCLLY